MHFRTITPARSRSSWPAAFALTLALAGATLPAQAVPAFARQTGTECAACHIGGVGPHLTPHGMRFKMSGYTEGDKSSLPFSGQVRISNNERLLPAELSNTRVDEVSLFLAGRIAGKLGAYAKVSQTADPFNTGAERNTELDRLDLRYADTLTTSAGDLLLGATLNNHPGVQDPLDANQALGFPALGTAGSLFNGTVSQGLPKRVLGLTAYALLDNRWYAEIGGYRSLSRSTQDKLGQDPQGDPGRLSGVAPYWRLAWLHDMKTQFIGVGLYGMTARRQIAVLSPQPLITERAGPTDKLSDIGVDAVYEYLGNRTHVVQLRLNTLRERRRYGSTPTNPFTGAVAPATATVRESTLAATYLFRQTYGITTAVMRSASADPVRYFPFGRTDSKTRYTEIFWTPFGKEDSWGAPWANLRLAAVWTRFDRFNGGERNVFGPFSPNAADLNTKQVYAQFTF